MKIFEYMLLNQIYSFTQQGSGQREMQVITFLFIQQQGNRIITKVSFISKIFWLKLEKKLPFCFLFSEIRESMLNMPHRVLKSQSSICYRKFMHSLNKDLLNNAMWTGLALFGVGFDMEGKLISLFYILPLALRPWTFLGICLLYWRRVIHSRWAAFWRLRGLEEVWLWLWVKP